MKRTFLVLFAVALIFGAMMITVSAEGAEIAPEAVEPPVEDVPPVEPPPADAPTIEPPPAVEIPDDRSFFEQAMDWISEHLSGIIVSLSAIYVAFPKWGGVATLIGLIKNVKSFVDSDNHLTSMVGDMVSKSMKIVNENMDKNNITLKDISAVVKGISPLVTSLIDALNIAEKDREDARNALIACQNAMKLMGKEFNDLISISTNISEKKKAELEADWMKQNAELERIMEANHDKQAESKNA